MYKEKIARKYSKMLAKELADNWGRDRDEMYNQFYSMYLNMLNSPEYDEFSKHHVSVPIVMCGVAVSLFTRDLGYSYEETVRIFTNLGHSKRYKFRRLVNFLERLPGGYGMLAAILKKVGIDDYGDDLGFDFIKHEKDIFEYKINRCIYIDIFEHYGIRKYCKTLCNSDIDVLGGACKNAKFIRYSDLSDGDSCHDALVRVKK